MEARVVMMEILFYTIGKMDGPKVDVRYSNEAKASFDAPSLWEDSKLVFKLIVIDD